MISTPMPNGVLLVDKPKGITSHDVIAVLRRVLKRKDIGHAGTLDPEASGLLVLLFGDATKLSDILLSGDKGYFVDVQFGTKTDSGDLAGKVIASSDIRPSAEMVSSSLSEMIGDFEWEVPIYSAAKVDGKKLYEYARADQAVVIPKKTMGFRSVRLISFDGNCARVELFCSKGSFMRTWAEKWGEKLGTVAVASGIRRSLSTPYSLDQTLPLNAITPENAYAEGKSWIPMEDTLQDWPSIRLEGNEEKLISNGQIPHKMARFLEIEYSSHQGVRALSRRTGRLLALLAPKSTGFGIQRVFPQN